MLWGTFMFEDADARVTFFSTADPAMIYNAPNPAMLATSVVTSASMGVCNVSRSGFWGEAKDGKLQFFAPVAADMRAKYESNFTSLTPTLVNDLFEPCPNQFKFSTYFNFPSTNAYNYPAFPVFYRNPVLSVGWDVRSIAKALGLNMGIIDFDGLSPISSPYGTKLGQIVSGTFWIDDNYAPMDPIFCANLTSLKYDLNLNVSDTQLDGPPVCVLTGGSFYSPFVYIPMIVSVRSDWDHCTCPGDAKKIGCNNQDYLVSAHAHYKIVNKILRVFLFSHL